MTSQLRATALLLWAFAISGCSTFVEVNPFGMSTDPHPSTPKVAPPVFLTEGSAPPHLDFGRAPVGTLSPTRHLLLLKNVSNRSATIEVLGLGGPHARDFQVFENTCTRTVVPGATCSIGLGFSPTSSGVRRALVGVAGLGIPLYGNIPPGVALP